MTEVRERRRRRPEAQRAAKPDTLPQLPWRRVVNSYPKYEIYSADLIEAVHNTSLRILEELGIECMSPRACDVLAKAGAKVDPITMNVRLDRGMVAEALRTCPSRFTLTPRNHEHAVHFGGNDVIFTLVAGPPNVHDCER